MVRLYIDSPLDKGKMIFLQDYHVHYLRNVLRFKCQDSLHVFNEGDGEWLATIEDLSKNKAQLAIQECIRLPSTEVKVRLAFAPLKPDALQYLVEKATELGVTYLHPVITEFTQISKLNGDKVKRYTIEAAQQCERLSLPKIDSLSPLTTFLKQWDHTIPLIVARERTNGQALISLLQKDYKGQEIAFFIGPEGGWSKGDIEQLSAYPFVHFSHLGPRILRAETAAVAVLSCFQAFKGDWK